MLSAMLDLSWTLGTVDGGGEGRRGCAMVRRGGEDCVDGGGGVLEVGNSGIDGGARSCAVDERYDGMCDTMSSVSGRPRVKLTITVDHSDIGRSCDMLMTGRRKPLFLRSLSSLMCR